MRRNEYPMSDVRRAGLDVVLSLRGSRAEITCYVGTQSLRFHVGTGDTDTSSSILHTLNLNFHHK